MLIFNFLSDKIMLVIKMYKMEQFIQAAVLLLLLTLYSVFTAPYPYVCFLTAGIFLILFSVRSLKDQNSIPFFIWQTILCAVFAVFSGNNFSYLIFYELRLKKSLLPLLPAGIFFVSHIFHSPDSLPAIICSTLFLLGISEIIYIVEHFISNYIFIQNQMTHAIRATAVNELFEKKLNQELTIKNYLAEKNARLEERENISRNIHNSVGHSITAAIITLDAADLLFDTAPWQAREKMKLANERIRTSLQSIRHAVRVLDKENSMVYIEDLICELTTAAENFMLDTAIKVHMLPPDADISQELPLEYTEFLTGALQELLSNGVRHGNADAFTVNLTADSRHIKLHVCDNGTSDFSQINQQERIEHGFGLKKLLSYAKRCGGYAVFTNKNGFQSEITLPLLKEVRDE